jgi:hypothetical protein
MKRLLFSTLIILTFAAACATGTPPGSIPDHPLRPLAGIDDSGLFSANQNGTKVAFANDGLYLLDPDSGDKKNLSSANPIALAWSPDGLSLAVAFERADFETELLVYSAGGMVLNEAVIPVALSQLYWSSRGDLLAVGFVLKVYSFGGNLRQLLYRIDDDTLVETLLTDSTLRPALAQQVKPLLHKLLPVSFTPQGDELVFLRLHDPPEFSPYFQLLYQNWQVDKPRALHKTPLQAMSFNWEPSGNIVNLLSAEWLQPLNLWPSEEKAVVPSTAETYRIIDGRLYHGLELLFDWGEKAQIQLLADGKFMLSVNRSLYLGDGLKSHSAPTYNETGWNLRRWRYEELVTPSEYQKLLEEIDQ